MPKTVKLSAWEQKKLHEQVIKLNKILIESFKITRERKKYLVFDDRSS